MTSRLGSKREKRPVCQLLVERLEDRLTPAVHEWTGLGADNLWSNSQNWTNGSPVSDLSGDIDLVFHTNLVNTANFVTQNDIVGLIVDTITFDADPGVIGGTTFATGGTSANGYTINGNAIVIDCDIDLLAGIADPTLGITQTFNVGLALNDDATFSSQEAGARLTLNGDIDLSTRTLTIDNTTGGANNAAIQGVVINGDISNGNIIKQGTGTLQLTGDNTYADTTINGGFVLVDSNTGLGAAAGTVTVNDPGQIQLRNGVTVVKTTLNLNSNTVGGGLGANGNTTNTFQGNVVLMAGNGGVALGAGNDTANANTRLIIDGVISGATSTLFINGAGTVQFTQNNTYTGITQINGLQGFSTVQIDAPAGLGAGGNANRIIINNAGGGQPGGTLALNFNGSLEDGGGIAEEIDFAGSGVGALGAIRSLGNTNVVIPGDITFIAAAPWVFAVDGALGSITTAGVIDSQGANRALTKIGPGTLIIGGAAANVFQGGVIVNSGVLSVQNASATPLGLLAGPSGGLVTVNDTGTLRVETGVNVPNPVQLNAGGTLAGAGTVSNNVTSTGGIVSPGASTAILSVVGNVTLDAVSAFRAEIDGTTAGTDFDQLDVNGTVNLGGATLHVQLGFVPAAGNQFVIIDATTVNGIFAGLPEGSKVIFDGTAFTISYLGGDVTLTTLFQVTPLIAAGADAGTQPRVRVFNADGTVRFDFRAYPETFLGGVRVATGDINNDGVDDIITSPGAGLKPRIKAFDGQTGALLRDLLAFGTTFVNGLYVGSGDVNNDGFADIIVGAGAGSQPRVRVFSGLDNSMLADFRVYNVPFLGGIRVAGGDINRDGFDDIITGSGPGTRARVKAFSGQNGALLQDFFAYNSFAEGIFVAAGDTNNDGFADIITGAGPGITPEVKVFNGEDGTFLRSFFAYGQTFRGGVRVAADDLNGDNFAEIITGSGPGIKSRVRIFDGLTDVELQSFFAFEDTFTSGIFVG